MAYGQSWRDRYTNTRRSIRSFDARLQKSYLGASMRRSAMEMSGYWYEGLSPRAQHQGWLGASGKISELAGRGDPYARAWQGAGRGGQSRVGAVSKTFHRQMGKHFMPGTVYKTGMKAGMGRMASGIAAGRNVLGATGVRTAARVGGRAMFAGIAPLATGYFMYQGYKEGGIMGAAKEGAIGLGAGMAFQQLGLLANPYVLAGAAVAAAGYGGYQLGEAASAHRKRITGLELATSGLTDALSSAGAATMRQRSMSALQNTHINGRMALGNEALMLHTSFR